MDRMIIENERIGKQIIQLTEKLVDEAGLRDKHLAVFSALSGVGSGVLMWEKTAEGVYTWANADHIQKFLQRSTIDEVIGFTDVEIAEENRRRGLNFTAGPLCFDSDKSTIAARKPQVYLEDFIIGGEYIALMVHKAPVFLGNEIRFTVGIAFDCTDFIVALREIKSKLVACDIQQCKGTDVVEETLKKYTFLSSV